tara:strand:+ start:39 stop:656 length:618 start_codon:yes stop_codon:yes gene_type:complete
MAIDNFIRKYNKVLPRTAISYLKSLIDGMYDKKRMLPSLSKSNISNNNKKDRSDVQVSLEPYYPEICKEINTCLIEKCLFPYLEDFSMLKGNFEWVSGAILVQKTKPSQGFHSWHGESSAWPNMERLLAWMIYLNDVEEGGETEFLYQQKRFTPKTNTALIWPGSWTHSHRGNPPISGNKYILTGWFTSATGMRHFSINDEANIK